MSYEKFYPGGWQSGENGGTPITPEALNHIEQGVLDALRRDGTTPMEGNLPMANHRITNVAAPLADGDAVNLAYTKKVGNPHNLLDNSDFRNPVNQRGRTTLTGDIWDFIVDRWYISLVNGETAELTANGLSVSGDYSLQQRFVKGYLRANAVYTSAIYYSDGSVELSNAPYLGGSDFDYLSVPIKGNKTVACIALYEGEYTAETLPKYQPKGYGAELVECMRYYQQTFIDTPKSTINLKLSFGANENWVQSISFDVPMRCTPTVTLYDYVTGTANAISRWANDSLVSDVTVGCIGNKSFSPMKTGGIITNEAYGFHYTASADL